VTELCLYVLLSLTDILMEAIIVMFILYHLHSATTKITHMITDFTRLNGLKNSI